MKTSIPGLFLDSELNGLSRFQIRTAVAQGQLFLHGAHLAAWQPAGHQPVLWLSGSSWFQAGRPIRGGVPICFPWFGPHPQDPALPAHGYARLQEWQLQQTQADDDGTLRLVLQTVVGNFQLRYEICPGAELSLQLVCQLSPDATEPENASNALQ